MQVGPAERHAVCHVHVYDYGLTSSGLTVWSAVQQAQHAVDLSQCEPEHEPEVSEAWCACEHVAGFFFVCFVVVVIFTFAFYIMIYGLFQALNMRIGKRK